MKGTKIVIKDVKDHKYSYILFVEINGKEMVEIPISKNEKNLEDVLYSAVYVHLYNKTEPINKIDFSKIIGKEFILGASFGNLIDKDIEEIKRNKLIILEKKLFEFIKNRDGWMTSRYPWLYQIYALKRLIKNENDEKANKIFDWLDEVMDHYEYLKKKINEEKYIKNLEDIKIDFSYYNYYDPQISLEEISYIEEE